MALWVRQDVSEGLPEPQEGYDARQCLIQKDHPALPAKKVDLLRLPARDRLAQASPRLLLLLLRAASDWPAQPRLNMPQLLDKVGDAWAQIRRGSRRRVASDV